MCIKSFLNFYNSIDSHSIVNVVDKSKIEDQIQNEKELNSTGNDIELNTVLAYNTNRHSTSYIITNTLFMYLKYFIPIRCNFGNI